MRSSSVNGKTVNGKAGLCGACRVHVDRVPMRPSQTQAAAVKPEEVTLKTIFLDGRFGRRLEPDFVLQAERRITVAVTWA